MNHEVILLQVEKIKVVCELCTKKCKSKRGLKRHKYMKHKDSIEEILFQNQVESCVGETKVTSVNIYIYIYSSLASILDFQHSALH